MNPYDDSIDENVSMAITTALLESQTPIAPDAARAARIRAKLLATVQAERTAADMSDSIDPSHFDSDRLYTLRAAEGQWLDMAPGIAIKVLRSDAQSRSYLLRMQAGARIPPHQHADVEEECYVLEGSARIGTISVTAGDYHLAPRGVPHDWLISDTGALLLLRADLQLRVLASV